MEFARNSERFGGLGKHHAWVGATEMLFPRLDQKAARSSGRDEVYAFGVKPSVPAYSAQPSCTWYVRGPTQCVPLNGERKL